MGACLAVLHLKLLFRVAPFGARVFGLASAHKGDTVARLGARLNGGARIAFNPIEIEVDASVVVVAHARAVATAQGAGNAGCAVFCNDHEWSTGVAKTNAVLAFTIDGDHGVVEVGNGFSREFPFVAVAAFLLAIARGFYNAPLPGIVHGAREQGNGFNLGQVIAGIVFELHQAHVGIGMVNHAFGGHALVGVGGIGANTEGAPF